MATTLVVPSTHLIKRGTIHQGLTTVSSTNWETHVGKTVEAVTGEKFQYAETCTTITAVPIAGYPAFWADSKKTLVTSAQKDAYGHSVAGVFCAAINLAACGQNFVWIMKAGRVASAAVSSCVATGDKLGAITGFFTTVTDVSTTYAVNSMIVQSAVALQAASGALADIQLIDK